MDKHITHTANFSTTLYTTPSTLPDINKVQSNWVHTRCQRALRTNATGIVASGATDIYFAVDAPVVNINCAALS